MMKIKGWILLLACSGSLTAPPAQAQSTKILIGKKNLISQSIAFTVKVEPGAHGEHFRIFVQPKAGKPLPSVYSARLNVRRGKEPIADCLLETKQQANGKGIVYGFFVSSKFITDSTFILVMRNGQTPRKEAMKVYVLHLKDFVKFKE
jgi:hypothetical protein